MTAEAFRRWYTSRNLTQTQVAGLLGIRQRRVSDMATGKSPVSRQTARQICMYTLWEGSEETRTGVWPDFRTLGTVLDILAELLP